MLALGCGPEPGSVDSETDAPATESAGGTGDASSAASTDASTAAPTTGAPTTGEPSETTGTGSTGDMVECSPLSVPPVTAAWSFAVDGAGALPAELHVQARVDSVEAQDGGWVAALAAEVDGEEQVFRVGYFTVPATDALLSVGEEVDLRFATTAKKGDWTDSWLAIQGLGETPDLALAAVSAHAIEPLWAIDYFGVLLQAFETSCELADRCVAARREAVGVLREGMSSVGFDGQRTFHPGPTGQLSLWTEMAGKTDESAACPSPPPAWYQIVMSDRAGP